MGRTALRPPAVRAALLLAALATLLRRHAAALPDALPAAQPGPPAAALTHAIDSMKSALLNATASSPSPNPSPPGSGQVALEAARAAAAAAGGAAGIEPGAAPAPAPAPAAPAASGGAADASVLSCDDPTCKPLVDALVAAVEDEACRGLYSTGKCPGACATAIAAVTANASWPGCEVACREDVVGAGVARWAELCGARAETLIDQGKEAMKSLVGDGLSGGAHARTLLQVFVGMAILLLGVVCGYRRGAVSAQMAYRLQRRRLGRKNSDANLSV